MLRDELQLLVESAVDRLIAAGRLPSAARVPVEITDTKNPDHGDFACNFALVATKKAGIPPRQIGELMRSELLVGETILETVEIAGPGFLNLRIKPSAIAAYVQTIISLGPRLPNEAAGSSEKPGRLNVEFVSVNPNGPITVGSARGAAFGHVLTRVFRAAGYAVDAEYYINDGVNSQQMRLFALSVRHYLQGLAFGSIKFIGNIEEHRELLQLNSDSIHALGPNLGGRPASFFRDEFIAYLVTVSQDPQSALRAAAHRILGKLGDSKDKSLAYACETRYQMAWATGDFVSPETLLPEGGYKGDYVFDVAAHIREQYAFEDLLSFLAESGLGKLQKIAQELMIERQRTDLALFGVDFNDWFSEQSMHDSGLVERSLQRVIDQGAADRECYRGVVARDDQGSHLEKLPEECGPLWLRSTQFGDDKDRVLVRTNERPAYIAGDVAYMESKLGERGYQKSYIILGPDHHGYIPRMNAVCQALGYPLDRFEIVIFQIVRFVKDGKPAPMRKRDGNIYELRDLIHEIGMNSAPSASLEEQQRIGVDVARFFYLMRSHDTHMDFDIDLATKQNDENPVFYVQYAHARICSVIAKASEAGFTAGPAEPYLQHPRELALIKKILDLPVEVARCARDYGVHRLTTYAIELARTYHHFYDACRVIQPDQPELSRARVSLCEAARAALKANLDLLGISAPERMDREPATEDAGS